METIYKKSKRNKILIDNASVKSKYIYICFILFLIKYKINILQYFYVSVTHVEIFIYFINF